MAAGVNFARELNFARDSGGTGVQRGDWSDHGDGAARPSRPVLYSDCWTKESL